MRKNILYFYYFGVFVIGLYLLEKKIINISFMWFIVSNMKL